MSRITVTRLGPGRFSVEVREGETTTTHRVLVPDDLLDGLGLGGADPAAVVEESFRFLLDREPATSILRDFPLDEISRYFPEYYDELRTPMGG
ncbi:MAG TPA: hypothetical protein VFV02_14640 [Acidimicrobiales bacterium]|nr:hypothetical protein [Acidimicrobiales bacterium]